MADDPLHPSRPTRVRWRILGLLLITAVLVHFNRISMSVAGKGHIMSDYGIEPTVMGTVYTAYLLVYAILMTPGGWLIDRYGPRRALVFMGFASALFVVLTGAAGALLKSGAILLPTLLVIRALLGAVATPIHPGAARAVYLWMPAEERSKGNGAVTCAALVGIAISYPGFGFLMDKVGWPVAFMISGAVTALLALVWKCYATDRPEDHRGVNAKELALIQRDRLSAPTIGILTRGPGLGSLLRNRTIVMLTLSYAAVSYFQYLFFYWMEYYFDTQLNLGTDRSRLYSTIATLAMGAGMAVGGWALNRMEGGLGKRRARVLISMIGMILSAVFLILGLLSKEPLQIVSLFSLALGALGTCEAAFWTTATEVGGRHGGTAAAIMNTGGNGGGQLAPILTPWLSKTRLGWTGAVSVAAFICLAGALLWLWIRPEERTTE